MNFIALSCLIGMAWTSRIILNKRSGSGHPYLAPNLRGKTFNVFTIYYNISSEFAVFDLYYVEVCFFLYPIC